MRKLYLLFVGLMFILFLISCQNKESTHEEIFLNVKENLNIKDEFVDENFNLYFIESNDNILIRYDTTNVNILEIKDKEAVINKTEEDQRVSLVVYITINDDTKHFFIDLIVEKIKSDNNENPENDKYSLTFYVNDMVYKTIKVKKGETIEFPKAPKKENKLFIGWSYKNKIINNDKKITNNMNLIAVFNKKENHEIINTKTKSLSKYDGISYIELTLDDTINNKNDLKIFINNENIYYNVDNKKVFIDNIALLGDYNLLIELDKNIELVNLKVINYTNEILIKEDLSELKIKTEYYLKETINLPKEGLRGTKYIWNHEDESNNKYLDLSNNMVTPLDEEVKIINLLVEGENNASKLTKKFSLNIGIPSLINLSELNDLSENKAFKTKGQIIGSYKENNYQYLYLKDKDNNSLVKTALKDEFNNGDIIELIGYKEQDYEFHIYKVLEKDIYTYSIIESILDIKDNLYNYIYIEGITSSELLNNEFNLFIGSNIRVENQTNEYIEINNLYYTDLYGYINKDDKGYFIQILDNDINQVKTSDSLIVNIITTEVPLNQTKTNDINRDIILPTKSKIFDNIMFNWISEEEKYLSNEGKYNSPNKKITSKLILEVIKDNKLIGKQEYKVTIHPE